MPESWWDLLMRDHENHTKIFPRTRGAVGMKVHIRYWPVRGPGGEYLGCVETVQDATAIQALSGERRLLDEPQ